MVKTYLSQWYFSKYHVTMMVVSVKTKLLLLQNGHQLSWYTQFHLGLDDASPVPSRASLRDIRSVVALAAPIFVAVAVAAHLLASLAGQSSPGLGQLVFVALLGGGLATVLVVLVAYYTTMSAFRFGLDPDTFGIPMVTSTLDLVGASALILAIGVVGVV